MNNDTTHTPRPPVWRKGRVIYDYQFIGISFPPLDDSQLSLIHRIILKRGGFSHTITDTLGRDWGNTI